MDKKQYNTNLGNAIRTLRHELGLSQEEMADKAGICRTYVGAIERGEKSISVYNLNRLLEAVNVPIGQFISQV